MSSEGREDGRLVFVDFQRKEKRDCAPGPVNTVSLVEQWHKLFDVPVRDKPGLPGGQRCALRIDLIDEEFRELRQAIFERDLVKALDALVDLQYVLDGTFCEFGLQGLKDEAFMEVHRSNLSKLDPDGHPIRRSDGKILKGPNYEPPNLALVIERSQR
jgi:predicted HAD superfamily Cof-like phosphohydrolase